MPLKQDIIIELKEIFPQHSEDAIGYLYDHVLLSLGVEDHSLLLTSCIESLVEMPYDIVENIFLSSQVNEPAILNPILVKGMSGFMEQTKKDIISIIKDVDDAFLERLINSLPQETTVEGAVNFILHHLLDIKIYPKCDKIKPQKQLTNLLQSNSCIQSTPEICTTSSATEYNRQSIQKLQNMFSYISTAAIRNIFYGEGRSSFALTYNLIMCEITEIKGGKKSVSDSMLRSFLKNKRKSISMPFVHPQLEKEIPANLVKHPSESTIDVPVCNQNYEETVECSCCYDDANFEEMIQCLEGHLFCKNCLRQYSNEAVYGAGKLQMYCMADSCSSTFPLSQLEKVLTEKELEKYHERVQEEDLKLANLNNLVRCPGCEFAAEMPDGDKVFKCQNETCMKEVCRYCNVDWEEHFGKPCAEVENRSETSLRTSYEEKMTLAKVRKCWNCEATFLKSDGCNKMTCRCGSPMCYICREPKIDYEHFCKHAREPGQKCTQCKKCSLWTDPTEDDDRAVFEIKQEAEKERMKITGCNSHVSKITVGPSIEVRPVPTSQPNIPIVPNVVPNIFPNIPIVPNIVPNIPIIPNVVPNIIPNNYPYNPYNHYYRNYRRHHRHNRNYIRRQNNQNNF
ncbi:E3 ubiquitin-protein ligase RNF216 isoform X2 [Hydra vulgaris]|uniref:E3 ubiquitin-protein ligase RNF216 isoform X2 n=1 Tax=Hydra vulgaris TaxID=6087 RepID=UPI001F5F4528|nr:E3 ubiquitin-protein ligase RNF216-like isoform X3 [Hydra vulgaris]